METVGYARTSTIDQVAGLDAQIRELQSAGCDKIFQEQASSVAIRDQLSAAIEYVRAGDVLIVTKLDRLARSTADLLLIAERLEKIGLEKERLEFCHLATNCGVKFVETLHQKSEALKRLGPNPAKIA